MSLYYYILLFILFKNDYINNLSIPTLSQWGVIALSIFMLIFGTLGIQNRISFKSSKNEPSAL